MDVHSVVRPDGIHSDYAVLQDVIKLTHNCHSGPENLPFSLDIQHYCEVVDDEHTEAEKEEKYTIDAVEN